MMVNKNSSVQTLSLRVNHN
ncbi:hypothetical protein LINPERPRIM_LOCUS20216 [Linum perenne]